MFFGKRPGGLELPKDPARRSDGLKQHAFVMDTCVVLYDIRILKLS